MRTNHRIRTARARITRHRVTPRRNMASAFARIDDIRLPEFYLFHDRRIMNSDTLDQMIATYRLRLQELQAEDETQHLHVVLVITGAKENRVNEAVS